MTVYIVVESFCNENWNIGCFDSRVDAETLVEMQKENRKMHDYDIEEWVLNEIRQ